MKISSGKIDRSLRVVIYGPEGIGKSTLASTAPKPLFLDTERGSGHLDVTRVSVNSFADLKDALETVVGLVKTKAFEYESLVLDTADNLWRLCADHVCAQGKKNSIEDFGYGKGYAMAFDTFRDVLHALDFINRHGVWIVVVSHAMVEKIAPPDAAEYSKYCIKVSAPTKQAQAAREYLKEWCDCLLFAHYEVTVNSEQKRAVGGAERILSTSSHPAWEAKNRVGLPEHLPMVAGCLDALWRHAAPQAEAESARVAAEQAVCPSSPEERTSSVYAEATPLRSSEESEDALLVRYFTATGKLTEGQGLDALPENIKRALAARRDAAVAKAREYLAL